MKIRNGFVSNSSSSSFVIDGNKYTCVDIALHMLEILNSEVDDYDYYEVIKNNLLKLKDKNISIFIPCSDDIKIVKHNDKIYVDASYHYEWDLDAIKFGGEGEYNDEIYSADNFYFPIYDNKILGKLANVGDDDASYEKRYPGKWIWNCEKCRCRQLELENGIVFCPNCLTDPNGNKVQIFFRKEKIERVLKNED